MPTAAMIAVKEEVHTTKSKEVDLDTLKALLVGDLVEDIGDLEGVEIHLEYRDDWSKEAAR